MSHFEYIPVSFDGGLYTESKGQRPPNAAAEMIDCHPRPGGGLRAFAKFTVESRAGIPDNLEAIGIFSRGGIPVRNGDPTTRSDFYLMAWDPTAARPKLYRWDKTDNVTPPTGWELIHTFAAASGAPPSMTHFLPYKTTTPVDETNVYASLKYDSDDDNGLWRINYDDGSLVQVFAGGNLISLIHHEDRIVFANSLGTAPSKIQWNEPGTETFDAANYWEILPYANLSQTAFLRAYQGELIVAKAGAPFVLMQGDIMDPTFRTLSDAVHAGNQIPAEIEEGLVFIVPGEGAFLTRTGSDPQMISQQLDPTDVARNTGQTVDQGVMAYASRWVTFPTGVIFDTLTRAWFRTSAFGIASNRGYGKYQHVDHHSTEQKLYLATTGDDFDVLSLPLDEHSWTRSPTWRAKSGRFHRDDGRRVVVREVSCVFESFSSAAKVTYIVNGVARQVRNIGAGKQIVKIPFEIEAETFELEIQVDSGSTAEAPALESCEVGTLRGRLALNDFVYDVVDAAPILAPIGDQLIPVDEEFVLTLEATDDDIYDTLTFTVVSGLPDGAVFSGRTLRWTPADSGDYEITFRVSDGQQTDSETITITVEPGTPVPVFALVADDLAGSYSDGNSISEWDGGNGFLFLPDGDPSNFYTTGPNGHAVVSIGEGNGSIRVDPGSIPDMTGDTQGSLFVVAMSLTGTLGFALQATKPPSGTGGFKCVLNYPGYPGPGALAMIGGIFQGNYRISDTDPAYDDYHLFEFYSDGSEWRMKLDGVDGGPPWQADVNSDGEWFGGGQPVELIIGGGNVFYLVEMQYFNEVLTTDEEDTIRADLQTKYGL